MEEIILILLKYIIKKLIEVSEKVIKLLRHLHTVPNDDFLIEIEGDENVERDFCNCSNLIILNNAKMINPTGKI